MRFNSGVKNEGAVLNKKISLFKTTQIIKLNNKKSEAPRRAVPARTWTPNPLNSCQKGSCAFFQENNINKNSQRLAKFLNVSHRSSKKELFLDKGSLLDFPELVLEDLSDYEEVDTTESVQGDESISRLDILQDEDFLTNKRE